MNNNAALRVFIGKGLGSFDGDFAVAVLNDNVASIFTEIFPNLDIDDLQMLLGRDGQLYVMDPLNTNPPSSEFSSDFSQEEREPELRQLVPLYRTDL
jgi:hypothetical protein